jgi:hypothetical protein
VIPEQEFFQTQNLGRDCPAKQFSQAAKIISEIQNGTEKHGLPRKDFLN